MCRKDLRLVVDNTSGGLGKIGNTKILVLHPGNLKNR